jgi:hypothetical protein
MRKNIIFRDVRIWLCDGCRPSYDSPPLFSGVALTDREYHALTGMIGRYLKKVQARNERAAQWKAENREE